MNASQPATAGAAGGNSEREVVKNKSEWITKAGLLRHQLLLHDGRGEQEMVKGLRSGSAPDHRYGTVSFKVRQRTSYDQLVMEEKTLSRELAGIRATAGGVGERASHRGGAAAVATDRPRPRTSSGGADKGPQGACRVSPSRKICRPSSPV
eukprot:jgi/Mesvir1/28879/Mv17974-RA.1